MDQSVRTDPWFSSHWLMEQFELIHGGQGGARGCSSSSTSTSTFITDPEEVFQDPIGILQQVLQDPLESI